MVTSAPRNVHMQVPQPPCATRREWGVWVVCACVRECVCGGGIMACCRVTIRLQWASGHRRVTRHKMHMRGAGGAAQRLKTCAQAGETPYPGAPPVARLANDVYDARRTCHRARPIRREEAQSHLQVQVASFPLSPPLPQNVPPRTPRQPARLRTGAPQQSHSVLFHSTCRVRAGAAGAACVRWVCLDIGGPLPGWPRGGERAASGACGDAARGSVRAPRASAHSAPRGG